MKLKKGFVIVLVIFFLAVLLLGAWVIVNIGCSEILETKVRNDLLTAYYLASAGAEEMYLTLRNQTNLLWQQTISGTVTVDSTTVGTFTATADSLSSDRFLIISEGNMNGRKSKVTVRYGYQADYTTGVPLGSIGAMSLSGASQSAQVKLQGPVVSNGSIGTNEYVNIDSGGSYENGSFGTLQSESFWPVGVTPYDVNGDETTDEKDAFVYYYTIYLDNASNNPTGNHLQIGSGESRYYSGNQSFDAGDIDKSVPIIFVDGNVTIDQNDQDWTGSGNLKHTVIATGDITITQPTNRPGDVLTIVAYGNVTSEGTMGSGGGAIGEFVVYANGNFTATKGGRTDGSIFAKGTITIDTETGTGKDHRVVNKSAIDWTSQLPLGLPQDHARVSVGFNIDEQSFKPPIWQRD